MCPTRLPAAQRREGGNGAQGFIQYDTEYGLANTFALTLKRPYRIPQQPCCEVCHQ